MLLDIKAAVKSTRHQLIISFCFLVLLKALLSLRFNSPWIFPDEASYAVMAADIFGSTHSNLPRAYPFIISIAYLFSANKVVIYHIILLTNSILSSLIIFPSYFILSKYCPKDFSFMGALTIATLPSLTLYTFVIMTENLFVSLFLFSIWFLLEAYEKRKPFWIFLSAISALSLFVTRHNGILMLVAMAISLFYYLLYGMRSGDLRRRLSDGMTVFILIILSLASLVSIGFFLIGSEHNSYLYWLHDRIKTDGQIFLELFTDTNYLQNYLSMLHKEIAYLMIGSYFVFFYIAIIFLFDIYSAKAKECGYARISSRLNSLSRGGLLAFKSGGVYFLSASVILLLLTTMSIYKFEQEVYGRYIDPLIPGLFIFGLVGLHQMYEVREKSNFRMLTIMCFVFTILFFYNFPFLKAEEFPILYANPLRNLAPNWIVFPALAAGFLLLLDLYKKFGNKWTSFFAVLIMFSVCVSAYSYCADLVYQSDRCHAMNQIGIYLNQNSGDESLIIMDDEILVNDWYFDSLIQFWMKGDHKYMSISDDFLIESEIGNSSIYIITSKELPFEILTYSTRGYYLYKFTMD